MSLIWPTLNLAILYLSILMMFSLSWDSSSLYIVFLISIRLLIKPHTSIRDQSISFKVNRRHLVTSIFIAWAKYALFDFFDSEIIIPISIYPFITDSWRNRTLPLGLFVFRVDRTKFLLYFNFSFNFLDWLVWAKVEYQKLRLKHRRSRKLKYLNILLLFFNYQLQFFCEASF